MQRSQGADFALVNMIHRLRILYLPSKAYHIKFTWTALMLCIIISNPVSKAYKKNPAWEWLNGRTYTPFFFFFYLGETLFCNFHMTRTYLIFQEGSLLKSSFDKIPEVSLMCLGHTQLGLDAVVWHRQIPSPNRKKDFETYSYKSFRSKREACRSSWNRQDSVMV